MSEIVQDCTIHVVSNTHWDREWYLTFEQFRVRLVDLMDRLIELFETDPGFKHFTLDGQTVPLEDYLEIRPEMEGKIGELASSGQLQLGPWYVLSDEFLVSGESLIRNLLRGHRIAGRYGPVMAVGYAPDVFGHISQLPQILQGFGIGSAVISRGIGREVRGPIGQEFSWRSPDGSSVLAVWSNYGRCATIPDDPERAAEIFREAIADYRRCGTNHHLLAFNGNDHFEAQANLSTCLAGARKALPGVEILHSTLPDFISCLQKEIGELVTVGGELRDPGSVLPGVLSSRTYLKQANARIETLLAYWAEPFGILAAQSGADYPRALLDYAWKRLLSNHPHDSICTTSTDAVHRDMEARFRWAEEVAETLTGRSLTALANCIDTTALRDDEPETSNDFGEEAIVVFNPLPWTRTDEVEAEVVFEEGLRWSPFGILREPRTEWVREFEILDDRGQSIPFAIRGVRVEPRTFLHPRRYVEVQESTVYRVVLMAENVPGLGYRSYRIHPQEAKDISGGDLLVGPASLENEFIRIDAGPNGALTVLHKPSGRIFPQIHYFEDGGDAGDEYHYSPPFCDHVVTSLGAAAEIAVVEDTPTSAALEIRWRLPVPQELAVEPAPVYGRRINVVMDTVESKRSDERVELPIRSVVRLRAGSPRIDFETTVENTARDHRLRVVFPTGLDAGQAPRQLPARLLADHAWADSAFDVVRRPVEPPSARDYHHEIPVPTHPFKSFVSVGGPEFSVTAMAVGLSEYEVKRDRTRGIALTLLRAVGQLSRCAVRYRRLCEVGYPAATPEAQCLRPHAFRYSLLLHQGDWQAAQAPRHALERVVGLRALQTDLHSGHLPLSAGFFEVDAPSVLVSAMKRAEDRGSFLVRLFNVSEEPQRAALRFGWPLSGAWRTDLKEERLEELTVRPDGSVEIEIGAHAIVTLEMQMSDV